MKRKIYLLFIVCLLQPIFQINIANAGNLINKLKGRIIIRVESSGEAYYVNPNDSKLYYLGKPDDAFKVIKSLGLGISNRDFNNLKGQILRKFAGKILIKVEDYGKAYYINPVNLKLYLLGRPEDAFDVMRKVGVGISNNDFSNLKNNLVSNGIKAKVLSNQEIIKKLKPAVVYIQTSDGSGSGMIIESNGYVLTNAHVVTGFNTVWQVPRILDI
jgi:hypothetical protein